MCERERLTSVKETAYYYYHRHCHSFVLLIHIIIIEPNTPRTMLPLDFLKKTTVIFNSSSSETIDYNPKQLFFKKREKEGDF